MSRSVFTIPDGAILSGSYSTSPSEWASETDTASTPSRRVNAFSIVDTQNEQCRPPSFTWRWAEAAVIEPGRLVEPHVPRPIDGDIFDLGRGAAAAAGLERGHHLSPPGSGS